MSRQIIIAIAREYGAGGHKIAEELANKYNLTLYDNGILEEIARERGFDASALREFEEKKKNVFLSRSVSGHSNSPQDIVTEMEFEFLKEKAESGESFVVVGRCASSVLKDYPGLVRIFITSDMDSKCRRLKGLMPELSDKEIEKLIISNNKKRKNFHNHYCKEKWGDSRYYDLIINTGKIDSKCAIEIADRYVRSQFGI